MKFGRQLFLNPADSDDSGFVKFSIRPRTGYRREGTDKTYIPAGHEVTWQIADCSQRIYLEFGYGMVLDADHTTPAQDIKTSLRKIKRRRAKMQRFVKAVNDAANAYFSALDSDEQTMLDYLEAQKTHKKEIDDAAKEESKARGDRYSRMRETIDRLEARSG